MDISGIKPIERTIEIKHPGTGAPLGIRVGILSIEDDKLQKIKREIADETLRLQSRNKYMKMDQVEANGARLLFAATTGWEWYNPTGKEGDKGYDPDAMPTFEDETPEYNPKNFNAVAKKLPWFADQIREEIDETKAFFEISKTT